VREEGGSVQWLERFDRRQEHRLRWEERDVDSAARTGRSDWYNCPVWMERQRYRDVKGWLVAEGAKKQIPAAEQVHNRTSNL